MSIKPLNGHYSFENPASVYDEESLTALELAGRTTAKVNETVQAFNELEKDTNDHLAEQDQSIEQRITAQDNRITKMNNETMPAKVTAEVKRKIDSGEFAEEIDRYAGNLESRVDNLLGQVSEGSTTMDAEVIDIRTRANGKTYTNAGSALRAVDTDLQTFKEDVTGISVLHSDQRKALWWTHAPSYTLEAGQKATNFTENGMKWSFTHDGAGGFGFTSQAFTIPNPGEKLFVDLDYTCNRETQLCVYVASSVFTDGQYAVICRPPVGHNIIAIDPGEFSFEVKYIWILNNGGVSGDYYEYNFNRITVCQNAMWHRGLFGETVSENVCNLADRMTETDTQLSGYQHLNITPYDFSSVWGATVGTSNNELVFQGSGNFGCECPIVYDRNANLRIEFDYETEAHHLSIMLSQGAMNGAEKTFVYIGEVYESSGHVSLSVDINNIAVYDGVNPDYMAILAHTDGEDTAITTITNIRVYQNRYMDYGLSDNIQDNLISLASKISGDTETVSDYLIGPDGGRYVRIVSTGGELVATPVVPKKALFIGNSLLLGMQTFGMAASSSKKDYYYLIGQAIREKKASYTASRISGAPFEQAETVDAQTAFYNSTLIPALSADLDLVMVQLCDNTGGETKTAMFQSGIDTFIKTIRTHAPKARVVWVGTWYAWQNLHIVTDACARWGIEFVNITDLNTTENQSVAGSIYTDDNGVEHEMPEAYATHPGDNGFRLISNRVLYELGIVDTETYYT